MENMEYLEDVLMDNIMGKRFHVFGSIICPCCKTDLKILKSFYPWERLEYQCEKCNNIINISDLGMKMKQQHELIKKEVVKEYKDK